MKKRQFLDRLSAALSALPEEERNRTIRYYNELLEDAMEDGLSEEEAVAQLEAPEVIAQQVLQDSGIDPMEYTPNYEKKRHKWWILLLAVLTFPIWGGIAVGILGGLVGILCGLFSGIIGLLAIPIGVAGGAVGGIGMSIILFCTGNAAKGLLLLGGGLICTALTIPMTFDISLCLAHQMCLAFPALAVPKDQKRVS